MARSVLSYTLSVSAHRSDRTIVTRRYPDLILSVTDEQARSIQNVVNGFDKNSPNYLRLTRVDNVDTESED